MKHKANDIETNSKQRTLSPMKDKAEDIESYES